MNAVEHPGVDGAPVVLLIHGLTDSLESFAGVVDELTPDHRVITYDRRGWGRSRDDEPPTSLADHAPLQEELRAWMSRARAAGLTGPGIEAMFLSTFRENPEGEK